VLLILYESKSQVLRSLGVGKQSKVRGTEIFGKEEKFDWNKRDVKRKRGSCLGLALPTRIKAHLFQQSRTGSAVAPTLISLHLYLVPCCRFWFEKGKHVQDACH